MIQPGETDVKKRTVYFPGYTADGLVASGGADVNYEGAVYPGAPTLEYEHNLDGWVAATGTFTVDGNGELSYAFALAECAIGLSKGTIAVRVTPTAAHRRTVMRVLFDTQSLQPGETSADRRRIYTTMFTSDGLLANGGTNALYEGTLLTGATVEYQHNLDGWVAAAGGALAIHGTDEWYYNPTAAETAAGLSKGTIAIRVTAAGFRTEIVRVSFGDTVSAVGVAPIITAISPTPGAAPGSTTGFATASDTVTITVADAGTNGLGVVVVTAMLDGVPEEVVYRDGIFRGRYLGSLVSGTTTLTFALRRRGGWTGANLNVGIDASDAVGATTTALFAYALPQGSAAAAVVFDFGNHLANALNRLPEQFRAKQTF